MKRGAPRSLATVVIVALFAGLIQIGSMTGALRVRTAVAVIAAFAIACVVFVAISPGRRQSLRRDVMPLALLALVPIGLGMARPDYGNGTWAYELMFKSAIWILGWALYLLGSASDDRNPVEPPGSSGTMRAPSTAVSIVGATILGLVVLASAKQFAWGDSPVIIDDMLFHLQARLFDQPRFSLQFDESVKPFFMLRQTAYMNGGMFTQYPPGWPAIVALFDTVRLGWWAGPIVGAGSIALTYLLGSRLHSQGVGISAALLLITERGFLVSGNSNGATTFFLLATANLAFAGRGDPRFRPLRWIFAGLSLGIAGATRPLTALLVGLTIAVWFIVSVKPDIKRLALLTILVVAGAVIPVALTLAYNKATTGKPLMFGYAAASGQLQTLGFGLRGMVRYSQTGPPQVSAKAFTLEIATRQFAALLWDFSVTLLPCGLLIPFIFASLRSRVSIDWRIVVAFLLLPAGYFFWYWSDMRFYVEIFPYIFIGIAILAVRLYHVRPALGYYFAVFLILLRPPIAIAGIAGTREVHEACRKTHESVVARSKSEPILLFVASDPGSSREAFLECSYDHNRPGLDGRIVVARDLGSADSSLISRYPGHRPIRLSWDPTRRQPVFEPIER